MPEVTFHLNKETHEVIVFSDRREVGVGVTEDLESPYFLKFYLTPWAYTALWQHTPLTQLFPWPVVHQVLDKWSPYLLAFITAPEPIEDIAKWSKYVASRLRKLQYKYLDTDASVSSLDLINSR